MRPDYERPLRGLADVPIERGRIGAMGVSGNDTGPVWFYVYRGLGFDVFEPQPEGTLPKPDPVVVAERRARDAERKAAAKEQRRRQWERDERRRQIAWDLERKREESLRQAALLAPVPTPEPPAPEADTPKPRPQSRTIIHPSPGWQPPTGEDLLGWLD